MSDDATFEPINRESSQRMFGPRAILLCGFTSNEQDRIAKILEDFESLPFSVACEGDEKQPVGDLLTRPHETGLGDQTDLPRLVLLSGLTQQELHLVMGAFRESDLPRPMWAALTPTSATWTLEALLEELDAERRAMAQARNRPSQPSQETEG